MSKREFLGKDKSGNNQVKIQVVSQKDSHKGNDLWQRLLKVSGMTAAYHWSFLLHTKGLHIANSKDRYVAVQTWDLLYGKVILWAIKASLWIQSIGWSAQRACSYAKIQWRRVRFREKRQSKMNPSFHVPNYIPFWQVRTLHSKSKKS